MNVPQTTPPPQIPPGSSPPQGRWRRSVRRAVRDAFRQNLSLKVIAGAMAVVAWLLVQGRPTAEEYATVQVDYVWPSDLVLDSDPVGQVLIKAVGPRSYLRELERRDLRYKIDLVDMVAGETTLYLTGMPVEDMPAGIEVVTISPSSLTFRFDERITVGLPVKVPTQGEVAFGFEIEEIVIEPDVVTLSGAASDLEPLEEVSTRVLDLSGRDKEFVELLPLDLGKMRARPEHDAEVSAYVRLKQIVDERTFEIPVLVPEELAGAVVEPATATVVLHGPLRELSAVDGLPLVVTLDPARLTFRDGAARAVYDTRDLQGLTVDTESLPTGVELRDFRPHRFNVTQAPEE